MSVRLRLTLWNVCILALMLMTLGIALRVTLQVLLLASIDRNLVGSLAQEQRRAQFPPPPRPGPDSLYGPPPRFATNDHPPFGNDHPPFGDAGRNQSPFGRFFPQSWDVHGKPFDPHGPPMANPSSRSPYDMPLFLQSRFGLQEQAWSTQSDGEQEVRFLSVPLRRDRKIVGVAQAGYPLTEMYAEIQRLTSVLLLLAGPALVLAGLGGAYLTSRALRPVRRITQAAGRIEAEDLSGRLPVAGRDELSELAATFNGMLGRIDEAFQEREAAYGRLEAVHARLEQAYEQQRRFTADASHELKTPLTVIEGTVSLALSSPRTPEQNRQSLERIARSAGVMTRIVQDLLLLARSDAGELLHQAQPLPLADALAVAREALSAPEPLPVITLAPTSAIVCGDASHLVRLFVNILENAVRHTPPHGSVTVTTAEDDQSVTVTIRDTGAGIAPEHLPHLFDRFYRVDAARARSHGGTGLGLAICRSIAEAHGGGIRIESVWGEGTTVHVTLPHAAPGSC